MLWLRTGWKRTTTEQRAIRVWIDASSPTAVCEPSRTIFGMGISSTYASGPHGYGTYISNDWFLNNRDDRATQHPESFALQHNSGSHKARVPNTPLCWLDYLFICICAQDAGAL
jgi:hypothetical protein